LHPYEIIIVDDQKRAIDYSMLIEICDGDTDDDDNDTYEIVIT
jgi:hypothetical protein